MPAPESWKLVLIDDESDIREVLSIALEDAGYRVAAASDGSTGLQLCSQIDPQIVITDIRMAGMDGLQVLETLKQRQPDTEVIVATAFGEMDLAIRALQLDASDFITKPINDESLHLALRRARQRYSARKQLKDYAALLETEKAQTVQELLHNIAYQKNLIESSMDGILGCDRQQQVITINRSMERMLGCDRDQILNQKKLEDFFLPGEAQRLVEALVGPGYGGPDRLFLYETALVGEGRRHIPVQVSAAVLREGQREEGLVCYFRDLRELRQLEREVADQARILHQDKMMSLGRLAASVVHEINNPLAGVLNYIRLMIRVVKRGPLGDAQREKFQRYLGLVDQEVDRCSRIIGGLLAFSRKSEPRLAPVAVADLVERCLMLSRHKLELSDISVEADIAADIPAVRADFNQLQQCLINLIFNAIDAMPTGGSIAIRADRDLSDGMVRITVQDSGPGIDPEDRPHIFEPFFTTKQEGYGVGLGLSTVFGIMERHQGSVSAASRPGQGAAFTLKLPTAA